MASLTQLWPAHRPGAGGEANREAFESAMKTVDVTFQNLDSSEISLTDVSHYFDSDPTKLVAGLRGDGKSPNAFIADTTTANAQVSTRESSGPSLLSITCGLHGCGILTPGHAWFTGKSWQVLKQLKLATGLRGSIEACWQLRLEVRLRFVLCDSAVGFSISVSPGTARFVPGDA